LAEPANELRGEPARNPVGEQEIDVLLRKYPKDLSSHRHRTVKTPG
jgi:hypothetical protein